MSLKDLKKYISGLTDKELPDIGYLSELVNKMYFQTENVNFERPQLLIPLYENEKLVIKNDRIMKSGLFFDHFGVYSKDGVEYVLLDAHGYWGELHFHEPEPFLEIFGFEYVKSFTVVSELITPVHTVEGAPKNKESVGTFSYSIERYKRPLKIVFPQGVEPFEPSSRSIKYSSSSRMRRNPEDSWALPCSGSRPKERDWFLEEGDNLIKYELNVYFQDWVNPLIEKKEDHVTAFYIKNTNPEADLKATVYRKGNLEKILEEFANWERVKERSKKHQRSKCS